MGAGRGCHCSGVGGAVVTGGVMGTGGLCSGVGESRCVGWRGV